MQQPSLGKTWRYLELMKFMRIRCFPWLKFGLCCCNQCSCLSTPACYLCHGCTSVSFIILGSWWTHPSEYVWQYLFQFWGWWPQSLWKVHGTIWGPIDKQKLRQVMIDIQHTPSITKFRVVYQGILRLGIFENCFLRVLHVDCSILAGRMPRGDASCF